MSEEKKEISELDVLFPKRDIQIGNGVNVTMRPLSVEDLPKTLKSFIKVYQKVQAGIPPEEVAVDCLSDITEILPFCTDRPMKQIPASALPDMITVFLEQNLTQDTVSKWTALAQSVAQLGGRVQGK